MVARTLSTYGFLASTLWTSYALAGESGVKLLDAGTGPQQELRFRPTLEHTQRTETTMLMSGHMDVMGMPVPLDMPSIILTMEVSIKEAPDGGNIRYDSLVSEAKVVGDNLPAHLVAAIEPHLRGVVGTRAEVEVTAWGEVLNSRFIVSDTASPELVQQFQKSLKDSGTALPQQAVGIGARWQTHDDIEEKGIKMGRTTTYTLRALEGTIASLDVDVAIAASPQDVVNDQLPPGSKMVLDKVSGGGKGQVTLDLTQTQPTAATLDFNTTMEMSVSAGEGQPSMPMKMAMQVGTRVRSL
jgi:hypothetical protein